MILAPSTAKCGVDIGAVYDLHTVGGVDASPLSLAGGGGGGGDFEKVNLVNFFDRHGAELLIRSKAECISNRASIQKRAVRFRKKSKASIQRQAV